MLRILNKDPDPKQGSGSWIRIRILNRAPDPAQSLSLLSLFSRVHMLLEYLEKICPFEELQKTGSAASFWSGKIMLPQLDLVSTDRKTTKEERLWPRKGHENNVYLHIWPKRFVTLMEAALYPPSLLSLALMRGRVPARQITLDYHRLIFLLPPVRRQKKDDEEGRDTGRRREDRGDCDTMKWPRREPRKMA